MLLSYWKQTLNNFKIDFFFDDTIHDFKFQWVSKLELDSEWRSKSFTNHLCLSLHNYSLIFGRNNNYTVQDDVNVIGTYKTNTR